MSLEKKSNNTPPLYSELEVTTNEEYLNEPYDETHRKFYKFSEEIGLTDHEIVNVNPEYVSRRHTLFTIREGFSQYTGHTIIILNNENKEVFNCKRKKNISVIYNKNNTPILNSKTVLSIKDPKKEINNNNQLHSLNEEIIISKGKNSNSEYGSLNSVNYYKKFKDIHQKIYTVKFTNFITKSIEYLEVRKLIKSHEYFVYCNIGSKNETPICRIDFCKGKCLVEVAPRIDYMFMLGISVGIERSISLNNNYVG